ncbi:MAG TPA: UbiX family flavin prenyltransferase [Ktedonobacteraceae bacterium]
MTKLIVGISGASGAIIGIRLLEVLRDLQIETHLVMTTWARATIEMETSYSVQQVTRLASVYHAETDQAATISSGSFPIDGMVIAPCSMKTVAHIRHGLADNLLCRAADVTLKERRKLVLLTRETPLSAIHLENMLDLTRMGAVMLPPMMTFYMPSHTLDEQIDHIVARSLDQFGLQSKHVQRWQGVSHNKTLTRPLDMAKVV